MILIVCAVVAIAALMFAAWAAEPGVRITWRKGEGWTAHREGWSGLEANTTV